MDFICLLLTVSNDPNRAPHFNFWFKTLNVLKSEPLPISKLIQAIETIFGYNDSIEEFLIPSKIELKIACAKTLLFIIHEKSLLGISPDQNTSEFLSLFNSFQWKLFLEKLFHSIIFISDDHRTFINEQFQFVSSLISIAIPCIHSCSNWSIQEIDIQLLLSMFSSISQSRSLNIVNNEHFVSWFYEISLVFPNLLQLFLKNDLTKQVFSYFLFVFHFQFETRKGVSFLHLIILTILIEFTSNYTVLLSLSSIKPNNFYDSLIETITNPEVENIHKTFHLSYLISVILVNISSVANHLSVKSSNRLILVFRQIFSHPYLFTQQDYQLICKNMWIAIYQLIRFQYETNFNLFLCLIENHEILINFRNENCENDIFYFIDKGKSIQKITDYKLKIEKYKQIISNCLMGQNNKPCKLIQYFLTSIDDFDDLWFDWLRLLFLITFPNDAKKAQLTFKTRKSNVNTSISSSQLESHPKEVKMESDNLFNSIDSRQKTIKASENTFVLNDQPQIDNQKPLTIASNQNDVIKSNENDPEFDYSEAFNNNDVNHLISTKSDLDDENSFLNEDLTDSNGDQLMHMNSGIHKTYQVLGDESSSTESLWLKKIDKIQDEIDNLLDENGELLKELDTE